jgi:hypothetical protein
LQSLQNQMHPHPLPPLQNQHQSHPHLSSPERDRAWPESLRARSHKSRRLCRVPHCLQRSSTKFICKP